MYTYTYQFKLITHNNEEILEREFQSEVDSEEMDISVSRAVYRELLAQYGRSISVWLLGKIRK